MTDHGALLIAIAALIHGSFTRFRLLRLASQFHESQKEGIFCGRCRKCWQDASGGQR